MTVVFAAYHSGKDLGPFVELANADARRVVEWLGLPTGDQLSGEATADDVLGRILIARWLLDVATAAGAGQPPERDAHYRGHYARALNRLQGLAQRAASQRVHVVWT